MLGDSQEVEFVSEGLLGADIVANLLDSGVLVLDHLSDLLVGSNAREQVGNLVGVHARSRHLNRTSPVEVVVGKGEGELLNLKLAEAGLVEGNEEMSWSHAALSAFDWDEEEVKLLCLRTTSTFNEVTVDDATTWGIVQSTLTIDDKE